MDRKQLKELLKPFQEKCAELGRPLADLCLDEAFPGDASTSFIIQVTAPWVEEMSCSEALDFLFDVLWETVDEQTRRKVFSIQVLDSKEDLHCWQDTVERQAEQPALFLEV